MTGKTVGGPKILLVDDDKIVIEALTDLFKRILPAVDIVDSATSGVEALELFASNAGQYALVLLDMSLEGKARKSAVACGWQTVPRRFSA